MKKRSIVLSKRNIAKKNAKKIQIITGLVKLFFL